MIYSDKKISWGLASALIKEMIPQNRKKLVHIVK